MLMDPEKLEHALSFIGKDELLRRKFLELCVEVEEKLSSPDGDIRDQVTGPIVDALFSEVGPIEKKLSNGIVFEFDYTSIIARAFVLSREPFPDHVWEPQTTKLLLLLSRNATNVLIGGAYFGDHAILIANQIASQGGVCHAFEPNKANAQKLERNAQINHLNNLRINCLGLWNRDSANLEFVGTDALASSEETATETDNSFRAVTIDSYLKSQNVPALDLIMIDIEGGELNALQGAADQLALPAESAPKIVFEVHSQYTDWSNGLQNTDVVKYVASFGYKIFAVRDIHSNYDLGDLPIEIITPETTYIKGPPHGFNMLAVKDESILATSDFRICSGVSPKYLLHRDPALFHPLS
jgi:FkbM family methyltransferase